MRKKIKNQDRFFHDPVRSVPSAKSSVDVVEFQEAMRAVILSESVSSVQP